MAIAAAYSSGSKLCFQLQRVYNIEKIITILEQRAPLTFHVSELIIDTIFVI